MLDDGNSETIAHASVKCRGYVYNFDEMWRLQAHLAQCTSKPPFGGYSFDCVNMEEKVHLLDIDNKYVNQYCLPISFIGKSIVVYRNQLPHLKKHLSQFSNSVLARDIEATIKLVITSPDYIAPDCNNNSIQFVKQLSDATLVAVRFSASRELKVRTIYPIEPVKYKRLKKFSFTNNKPNVV